MKDISQLSDYKDFSDRLITVFKNKPNCFAIINSILDKGNSIEDALFEIRDLYTLENAVGVQLDVIGEIIGESRLGKSDFDYRNAIYFRIVVNNYSGTFTAISTLLLELLQATKVQMQNLGNANLYVYTDIIITDSIYSQLLRIMPVGVKLYIIFSDSTNPFVFYGDDDGSGFGKIDTDDLTFSDLSTATFSDGEIIEMQSTGAEVDPEDGGELQATIG